MPGRVSLPEFHVALSFAREQRPYVEKVAKRLRDAGAKVFYDDYERTDLWGKNLYDHLDHIYREASHYCIMFISEDYARKVWTGHERRSAQARALKENREYVLPVRFDEAEVPAMLETVSYLDARILDPDELAEVMLKKLEPLDLIPRFPDNLDHLMVELKISGPRFHNAQDEAEGVLRSFYEALSRMTLDERTVIGAIYTYGCCHKDAGGCHISIELLSRTLRMPRVKIFNCLRQLDCLNFKVVVRPPLRGHFEPGQIAPDDKDILVNFWAARSPKAKKPDVVIEAAITAMHVCSEHAVQSISDMNFHNLSSAPNPRLAPDLHASGEHCSAPTDEHAV